MTKSRSFDGCSKLMACENGGAPPWSDPNSDLLYLVLMKLEVFDFRAFSEVCKSWRSLALSNKTAFMASRPPIAISISTSPNKNVFLNKSEFMASRPPMAISISTCSNKTEYWLEDSEGGKSKLPLPRSRARTCVGLTCGYLVFFGRITLDFWLVNPITRHALHFPRRHNIRSPIISGHFNREGARAILVFSHSASAWVFVFLFRYTHGLWYSIVGTGAWKYVHSNTPIRDLHEFKGKIYVINSQSILCELRLDTCHRFPVHNLAVLDTKNFVESMHRDMPPLYVEFVSSGEKLYAIAWFSEDSYEVHELDFGEMKWVSTEEKTMKEYALFVSNLKQSALIKRELLPDCWSRYKKYAYCGNKMLFNADIWYFSHDCMKVKSHT